MAMRQEEFEFNADERPVRTPIKWAGGKTRLLPSIIPVFLSKDMLHDGNVYIEPFAGSCSVALALRFKKAILNDKNIKLINFFKQVQLRPEKLIDKITKYVDKYMACNNMQEKEEFFYNTRKLYNKLVLVKANGLTHASLFWFLNKTCFNGMYRETACGDFNIPFGKRDCPYPAADVFLDTHDALKKYTLSSKQFDVVCAIAKKGDVVYLDPPYIPVSKTSSFIDYLRYGFGIEKHHELCKIMQDMSDKGAVVVMSNSFCDTTREIYGKLKGFRFFEVSTKRFISGKAHGRKEVKEFIITNK